MPDQDSFSVSLSADISDLTDKMSEAKGAIEETAESMKSAGEEGGSGFGEAMEGLGEAMEALHEKSEGMAEMLGKMSEGWTGLIGVMGGGAIAELMSKVAETVFEVGDSLRQTSAVLNVSASDGRAFNETMESLGVSSGAASMAIRRLEQDASNGGKSLERLGISATQANGEMKSGLELFTEVVERLNNLSDANQRAEAAFTLFGRSGAQLLSVLGLIPAQLEEARAAQEANSEANDRAAEQSLKLHETLTELGSAFNDDVIRLSPLVVSALLIIDSALIELTGYAQAAGVAMQNVLALGGKLAGMAGAATVSAGDLLNLEGGHGSQEQIDKFLADQEKLKAATDSYGDSWTEVGKKISDVVTEAQRKSTDMLDKATGVGAYSPNQGFESEYGVQQGDGSAHWAPKGGGRGGGRGGGGGGADDMTGMDDALTKASDQMNKLNSEFTKMGSEASMAAKEGGMSYDQLRDRATQDYQQMQAKYKEFQTAVESGSKDGAKQAETAWHEAAQKFQQDWEQAKQKATQDMQQIKSTADTMASEVSGILNQAISGKLNWAQEFDKILSQMLDKLIKHLAQQIAMWAANEMQVNAIKQAGATAGLAEQKAANTAAGTSDAVTAAKGAYASAAQIPYVGWLIAPIAGAAAFAGVEAFGSAQGGFEVPPGAYPQVALHPRELVLPSDIAGGMKQLIAGGGAGPRNINVTSNVNALDSRSVADVIDSAHASIAKAAAKYHRGGGRTYLG